ncbi:MAG: tRNA uridine-5-carboxymethylaminomethyl(34) synthesis GTPase MnmE [Oscillospiraceae bacterium]|nr:tRNA uridine-5-carboxymethylaminomethyl(34) synthesis GTPase MnmE [Oscillospiraceae bacterium]
MSDTIAAIATGASVSAIGIVRLSGENAIAAAERLFTPLSGEKLSLREDRKLIYGRLTGRKGKLLDLCLCTISHAPASYTGEDTAELQCHGSPTLLRAVLEELFALGVRQARPGEFTKRAFLNGRLELTAAEAVADLIDAETVEAAGNAAGQLSGAISRKTDAIYSSLVDICSHYHAVLDYPDEDIEPFLLENYKDILKNAEAALSALQKTYERGKLMNSGIPTAIIGRPNAGKSSLLNALLGYDRAIVTAIPGTTRDTIEEKIRIGQNILRLIDTAGIRETADEAEKLGVERSYAAISEASLVIAVVDGSVAFTEEDSAILRFAENAPKAIVAVSKQDLPGFSSAPIKTALPVVEISAETGEGIDALEAAIQEIFPLPSVPAGEILTNARQAEAVSMALEYIKAALCALEMGETPDIVLTEAEGAMQAIGELSGRTVREDVTERIFARFCVGK